MDSSLKVSVHNSVVLERHRILILTVIFLFYKERQTSYQSLILAVF